ncbi:MAG: hypothetical protein JO306_12395 [Gemmatimonadetes bacterium]|nr:hypothetical protein [Gemmatimonadota bacterium]
MPFSIRFLDEGDDDARYGEIRLGDFGERFLANLSFWSEAEYERQWRDAVGRILSAEDAVSALITSTGDPSDTAGVMWWTMYRQGALIQVQNHICFFDQLPEPFDLADPYRSVPPHRRVGEDGEAISEWTVTVAEVESFASSSTSR